MRFLVMVKATKESEAGQLPTSEMLSEMGTFNERLVKAGVMLSAEGLQPSSKGARVKFTNGQPAVTDGPFAETKELVAGFWIWRVKSREEAIDWLKQAPFHHEEVELRQIFEMEDLAPVLTQEIRERWDRQTSQLAKGK